MTPYKRISRDGHHRADSAGNVMEHIVIAEAALGKPLPLSVEIHHVDGNKRNNANRNLVICQDREYHLLLHVRARIVRAGGDPNTQRLCSGCKALKPFAAFNKAKADKAYGLQGQCRECQSRYCSGYERPLPTVQPFC